MDRTALVSCHLASNLISFESIQPKGFGILVKRTTNTSAPSPAILSRDQLTRGIARLTKRLDAVEAFDPKTLDRNDPESTVRPLEASIETALAETFGHGTIEYFRYQPAAVFDWPVSFYEETSHQEKIQAVAEDKLRSVQLLSQAIELLKERVEDLSPQTAPMDVSKSTATSKRVFIVHGQDAEPKESVARFLTSLGYEPIILHEQANKGRTIIQKFRDEASDVGFAVVLMTPDDKMPDGATRARQNVILELGFFLGALGPDRVAALVKGDIQKPSDFDGVVYTPYDSGWKAALGKELQAAGYDVDWNKIMR